MPPTHRWIPFSMSVHRVFVGTKERLTKPIGSTPPAWVDEIDVDEVLARKKQPEYRDVVLERHLARLSRKRFVPTAKERKLKNQTRGILDTERKEHHGDSKSPFSIPFGHVEEPGQKELMRSGMTLEQH
eukprot:gene24549-1583_t